MELLLIKHVPNLGHEGDIVKVKPGFARNYLLPKQFAKKVKDADIFLKEKLQKIGQTRRLQEIENLKELKEAIAQADIEIKVKSGKDKKMFGSVTNLDIAKALEEKNIVIDRKKIQLEKPIKVLGSYNVQIKLHQDVDVALLKVNVISEIDSTSASSQQEDSSEESGESEDSGEIEISESSEESTDDESESIDQED